MKKFLSVFIILWFALLVSVNTFSQCSDGQVNCYGIYTVNDSQTPTGDYYEVYIKVTNLCPDATDWIWLATLYQSDLGQSQNINGKTIDIGVPTSNESYYYWTVSLYVVKYVHDEIVDSQTRSSYAGRSGSTLTTYNSMSFSFN